MANPFTTGGFNCCTCPEPPDFDAEVDDPLATYINRCGCPVVSVACTSESKTATLCGYSEYTGGAAVASSPPKKYRTQIDLTYQTSIGRICCGSTPTISSRKNLIRQRNYTDEYNADDCSVTQSHDDGEVENIIYVTCTSTVYTTTTGTVDTIGASEYAVISTTSQTADLSEDSLQTTGPCTPPDYIRTEAVWTGSKTLSIEDTELDALARATATTGTYCSSIYQLRTTSFSFTERTVTYTATASNLVIGVAYEGCVRVRRRESYSGTAPVDADTAWYDVAPDTIASFTATATEEEVATDVAVPNAQGYEYEVVGAYVWPVSAGCDCPTSYVAP